MNTIINDVILKLQRCYKIQKKYNIHAAVIYADDDYGEDRLVLDSLHCRSNCISYIEQYDSGWNEWKSLYRWLLIIDDTHVSVNMSVIENSFSFPRKWLLRNWRLPRISHSMYLNAFVGESIDRFEDNAKNEFIMWAHLISSGTIGYFYVPETLLKVEGI